jgi:hypothetical protein
LADEIVQVPVKRGARHPGNEHQLTDSHPSSGAAQSAFRSASTGD